jgi:hypothetical protein
MAGFLLAAARVRCHVRSGEVEFLMDNVALGKISREYCGKR